MSTRTRDRANRRTVTMPDRVGPHVKLGMGDFVIVEESGGHEDARDPNFAVLFIVGSSF